MSDEANWTYYPWLASTKAQLKFSDLLEVQPSSLKPEDRLADFIYYAEMSYLACRILMISSVTVHPAALYMASQTIEKYMKALLLRLRKKVPRIHQLTKLTKEVRKAFADSNVDPALAKAFADEEFLMLCEHLEKFEAAGRYPPEGLAGWQYSLNVLAFLDEFIIRCRNLIGIGNNTPNIVRNLLTQEPAGNVVMAAAIAAAQDNNHYVDELLNPPLPSKATIGQSEVAAPQKRRTS